MDLTEFRSLFPSLQRIVYLNTATVAPAASPVLDALRRAETEWESGQFSWHAWEAEAEATRGAFARLIGAKEETVALMTTVSEVAATVAGSLSPASGGRVVVGDFEFRSNLFPWMALRSRGFEVTLVPSREGVVRTEDLVAAIDDKTVLVAVSEVQSSNGFRIRLADVADRCRGVGARLFVNLTQLVGALRFDVGSFEPDFVAAHGYKFLLAPRGASWLYVRADRLDEVEPLAPNWKSVSDPYANYYGGPYELADGAKKLDAALAWFPWVGAKAALDIQASLDRVEVEKRCLSLAGTFRSEARSAGFTTIAEEEPSQIVGLSVPDPDGIKRRLAEQRIEAAVRGGFVRVAFHAFNNEEDIESGLKALGRGGG